LECQGVCVYVGPEKVELDAPLSATPFEAVPAILGIVETNLTKAAWQTRSGSLHVGLPARLHLLDQVLLI